MLKQGNYQVNYYFRFLTFEMSNIYLIKLLSRGKTVHLPNSLETNAWSKLKKNVINDLFKGSGSLILATLPKKKQLNFYVITVFVYIKSQNL